MRCWPGPAGRLVAPTWPLGTISATRRRRCCCARPGPAGRRGWRRCRWWAGQTVARLLRPLLAVLPGRLRATLAAAGVGWVEDPTNQDLKTPRARLRAGILSDPGPVAALAEAANAHGAIRAQAEQRAATEIAASVSLFPEGIAHIRGVIGAESLSALIWTISGSVHPPPTAGVARLQLAMQAGPRRSGTLHGACLMPARPSDGGWLLGREAAAMQGDVPAGARWDGRFLAGVVGDGLVLGPLGKDAALLRRWSRWPSLPAADLANPPQGWCYRIGPACGLPG